MILLTGAAGFIGSCLLSDFLKNKQETIIVDDFSKAEKWGNLVNKDFYKKIERGELFSNFSKWTEIDFVIHIGARTDTAEFDKSILNKLNLNFSQKIWEKCTENNIPLIYASSAATYGLGEFGYDDNHEIIEKLKPLNAYGESKNDFDKWVLAQEKTPPFWAGLKFFNVFGPNEYHKARMASVIFHAYRQIKQTGGMKLFKSHKAEFKDGEQIRDFVYVKDVISVINFLMGKTTDSGIYNLGTGKARTFKDLAKATFSAMGIEENISFIDTPEDIREKYQYFTEANMIKLRNSGYKKEFYSLENGVKDYVQNYLMKLRFI